MCVCLCVCVFLVSIPVKGFSSKPSPPAYIYSIFVCVCVWLVHIHTQSPHSFLLHLALSAHSTPILFFFSTLLFSFFKYSLFKCFFSLRVYFCDAGAAVGSTPETQKRNRDGEGRMCVWHRKRMCFSLLNKLIPTLFWDPEQPHFSVAPFVHKLLWAGWQQLSL